MSLAGVTGGTSGPHPWPDPHPQTGGSTGAEIYSRNLSIITEVAQPVQLLSLLVPSAPGLSAAAIGFRQPGWRKRVKIDKLDI